MTTTSPNQTVRTAGLIALSVLIVGIMAIAAQYVGVGTPGASAGLTDYAPQTEDVVVNGHDFTQAQQLIAKYFQKSDLATKNQIILELRDAMAKWPADTRATSN